MLTFKAERREKELKVTGGENQHLQPFFSFEFLIGSSWWHIICYQGQSIKIFSNISKSWLKIDKQFIYI